MIDSKEEKRYISAQKKNLKMKYDGTKLMLKVYKQRIMN